MTSSRYASDLESSLRAFSNPERALQEKRYLKSELEFLGATLWEIRRVAKDFIKEHPGLDRSQTLALARGLWSKRQFERRMAAVVLLEHSAMQLLPEDIDFIEELIRDSQGWAFVSLSGDIAGYVLVRHPDAVARIDPWASDPDFWVRRSALLSCLAPHKAGWPLDRFFGYADSMLQEKEFFIRKAIGWVLRDAGKKRPDEVFSWLRPRVARSSGVTIREAVKYLVPAQRDELLTAYKQHA